ncbi:MAG TPA: carbamoyl-phosphate synthase large subunit [Actinobacteria bacterium]|nr:carbamoyl-phosphate synthase large subunit [Actinomycetota bacterium]
MPRRDDLESILLIGSGPIVIGQACEFDYSGTQALKVLREDGYRVVLVNSNPATIMTDPEFADATYVEPITAEVVAAIIAKERPDALLPTLGGQTALNVTTELAAAGVLDDYGVELLGASLDAIEAAEDRGRFKELMARTGIPTAEGRYVRSIDEALAAASELGYPLMVRPSYILGGGGTGVAHHEEELRAIVEAGIAASPVGEVLVEESVLGWKEFELEVMRDHADNAVIVCAIENLDPMGVHTGDSITVAPTMTLSDREYQEMRDEAIACLRAVGVETGGSNVQFAVDPRTGRRLIVEMNPRVSRSSALASKATGFPIAKIAAKLAVGYTLDEIPNDITRATPASFEPALDFVVVKVPRFDFAKFPSAEPVLGTTMRSVGEAMAIGRTFVEALQKALRSLETGRAGLNADPAETALLDLDDDELAAAVAAPSPDRIYAVAEALRRGWKVAEVAEATKIDPWFLEELAAAVEVRRRLERTGPGDVEVLREAKRHGYSDRQLAYLWGIDTDEVEARRRELDVEATYKTVDTCAAEFEAKTPYFYSTYEDESEAIPMPGEAIAVLGSGPNRIGQGIEFDYCCVHAAFAIAETGRRTVMVNCNPETVSTDYDTSDRLYFEPLTGEDVAAVAEAEGIAGAIVQLGGQTPLGLAPFLQARGIPIAGTSPESIDLAEDRERFSTLCTELGVAQPAHGIARSVPEAMDIVDRIGLPVLVRPSYVLGGRAMRIVYSVDDLSEYLTELYGGARAGEIDLETTPLLIDRFLEGAVEVDVDALYDGERLYIGGIMEHVEEAGVHSGDSACALPPQGLLPAAEETIRRYTAALARGLGVRGLLNIQFAVRGEEVFVLEANPRASRTVPFVSKATGVPLAKIATRIMLGERLADLQAEGLLPVDTPELPYVAVKEAVLPWNRFPGEDTVLGPEMRSTGEVMGIGPDFGVAYAKALLAAGHRVPASGTLFLSLADGDKPLGVEVARRFVDHGFRIFATHGTAGHLARHGIRATHVDKVGEGPYDPVRLIEEGAIHLVINTPRGRRARGDGRLIRMAANRLGVPAVTTIQGGLAVAKSLAAGSEALERVASLQEHHRAAGLG